MYSKEPPAAIDPRLLQLEHSWKVFTVAIVKIWIYGGDKCFLACDIVFLSRNFCIWLHSAAIKLQPEIWLYSPLTLKLKSSVIPSYLQQLRGVSKIMSFLYYANFEKFIHIVDSSLYSGLRQETISRLQKEKTLLYDINPVFASLKW